MKQRGSVFLMGITLVGSIWSFALAIATSKNYLICAGVPGAGADLIHQAEESYQTLLTFQSVVALTAIVTLILVIISAFSLYVTWGRYGTSSAN